MLSFGKDTFSFFCPEFSSLLSSQFFPDSIDGYESLLPALIVVVANISDLRIALSCFRHTSSRSSPSLFLSRVTSTLIEHEMIPLGVSVRIGATIVVELG